MKLLFDNMLSPWIASELSAAGHDAAHVQDFSMSSATDAAILDLARQEDRSIVSADIDFANLLALGRWKKPSLLLLRDMPRRREAILALLLAALPALEEALKQGSIVTLRRGRIRVRPLPIVR